MRPEAVGGPSLTTFVCALNGRAGLRSGRLSVSGSGAEPSQPLPATPRKESVHNRFARRPEPMVWRPSGETRFMGWTVNTSRRRDRLRHRPHLENLDDRCLLSTGLDSHLAHVAATARERPAGMISRVHHDVTQGKGASSWSGSCHAAAHRERPAGTMTSGAGAAYDSIIGASQVQSNYNVNGSGMTVAVIDTGVDYNNPALGSGFGPGARSSPAMISPTTRPIPWPRPPSTARPSPGLIGSTSPGPGRRARSEYRRPEGHRRYQYRQPRQYRRGDSNGSSIITPSTISPRSTCRSPTATTTPRTGSRPPAGRPNRSPT